MSDGGMPIRSDISSVLAQMRSMREAVQADLRPNIRETGEISASRGDSDFASLLKSSIDSVNDLQLDASTLSTAFVRGENKDLVGVMIAAQKSSIAFQALSQVRNRVVSAYQDIMNMPI